MIKLYRAETLIPRHIHYLNRLSDLLFVLCRILNREHGIDDVMWQPGKNRGIEAA